MILSINQSVLSRMLRLTMPFVSLRDSGRAALCQKTDIKSAFRIIPVHPLDYHILGMHWEGNYYYDKALPMGCSSSCKIFETFSTSLEWIAKNKLGIPHIIHILDDFLIIEPTIRECKASLDRFLTFCSEIGVPMAPEKNCGSIPGYNICRD